MRRVNLSLPPEVMGNLDMVSRSLGISRSACVAILVEDPLRLLVDDLGALPLVDGESPRRFRGHSIKSIRRLVKEHLGDRTFLEVVFQEGGKR